MPFSTNAGKLIDFDNDGDLDLIATTGPLLFWQENDGSNNFSTIHEITTASNQIIHFVIKDMENDGDLDVVYLRSSNNAVRCAKNDGNLNFTISNILMRPFGNYYNEASLFIADLNQDGKLDILSEGLIANDELDWYENDLTGGYIKRQIVDELKGANFITTSDLNGDGLLDLIVNSKNDKQLNWVAGLGNGNFSGPKSITSQLSTINSVHTTDLDNDGDQDILYSSHANGTLSWLQNDGAGNFTQQIIVAQIDNPITNIHFGDFNQDGNLDIVTDSRTGIGLSWYQNNGDATFSPQSISPQIRNTKFLLIADLDGNGTQDIITANNREDGINWYRNTGGLFAPPERIGTAETNHNSTYLGVADLNNDGHLDVLANNSNDCLNNPYFWYENAGGGSFLPRKIITSEACIPGIIANGDFDGDNYLDVVHVSLEGGRIAYQLNEGAGIFSPQQVLTTENSFISFVHTADIDNDGDIDILFTDPNTNKVAWFENFSNHPIISGFSYWDENENGKFDNSESRIKNISLEIAPDALSAITDTDGNFQFYVDNGNYQLKPIPNPCWELTSDSASFNINIVNSVAIHKNFGFKLVGSTIKSNVTLQSTPTRCTNDIQFWLAVENEGCQPINGAFGVVINDNIKLLDLPVAPDEVRMDTLIWFHDELISGANQVINFTTERPGVDALGDSISLLALSFIRNDQNQLVLSSTYDYASEIRCAFDPNDKLVYPNRNAEYDQNYTLFEEALEYTIRFQNTGNDTAFNIVLRDNLDTNLDWTTFKPVVASHPFETLLHKNGLVEFSFKNILLPDSTTNEVLSHGFVTYKIAPKNGLSENTLIENTAHIYFDFNPPIITNTTKNIFVSEFPKTTPIHEIGQQSVVKVYPNPFAQQLLFEVYDLNPVNLPIIQLFDAKGRLIHSSKMTAKVFKMPISNLVNGLYFYQIIKSDGVIIDNGKLVKD